MYKEKIEEYINTHIQEMLEDICELCRINSVKMPAEEDMPYGPAVAECLDAALDMAEGYGFEVQDYDGYVGCVDMDSTLPAQLDILAHLDIVPAGEGWQETEPFEPVVKDGMLYGRGTQDDKGPAVAALYAMRAVKELGIPLKKNVRLILGTDEECGSSDIEHYYKIEKEAPMTFSPDAQYPLVNVEKGRLEGHFTAKFQPSDALPRLVKIEAGTKVNVVPGKARATVEGLELSVLEEAARKAQEKTGITFQFAPEAPFCEITAVGVGSHASRPQDGKNAITGLLELLCSLPLADCPQMEYLRKTAALMPHGDVNGTALGIDMEDEVSGRLTLAFSMLTADGSGLDGQFDSRVPVCGNEDNVLKVVKARMAEQGLELLSDSMTPPHMVEGDSLLVKTLLSIYERYTQKEGKCLAIGGATYVHDLKNGVAFGASMPGTENRMHGADEFAVVEELAVSAKMFAQAIVELCG